MEFQYVKASLWITTAQVIDWELQMYFLPLRNPISEGVVYGFYVLPHSCTYEPHLSSELYLYLEQMDPYYLQSHLWKDLLYLLVIFLHFLTSLLFVTEKAPTKYLPIGHFRFMTWSSWLLNLIGYVVRSINLVYNRLYVI